MIIYSKYSFSTFTISNCVIIWLNYSISSQDWRPLFAGRLCADRPLVITTRDDSADPPRENKLQSTRSTVKLNWSKILKADCFLHYAALTSTAAYSTLTTVLLHIKGNGSKINVLCVVISWLSLVSYQVLRGHQLWHFIRWFLGSCALVTVSHLIHTLTFLKSLMTSSPTCAKRTMTLLL